MLQKLPARTVGHQNLSRLNPGIRTPESPCIVLNCQRISTQQATFTEVDDASQDSIMSEGGDGVIEELCGDEKALNETQVMVNIIKVRDQEEMTKYALAVVWGMFPTLESKIYLTGKC